MELYGPTLAIAVGQLASGPGKVLVPCGHDLAPERSVMGTGFGQDMERWHYNIAALATAQDTDVGRTPAVFLLNSSVPAVVA
jgi:hypothetical protein